MNFKVEEKGHRHPAAQQATFIRREQQQRQPGKQGDNDDAFAQQFECIARQVGAAKKLVQRSAQHQREVSRLTGEVFRQRRLVE